MFIHRLDLINGGNPTPNEIAHHLIDNLGNSLADRSDYTIGILGKPGPRGKTWLRDTLRQHGLNAVEISADICYLVDYGYGERNFYILDPVDKHITIVLNAPFAN